MVHTNMAGSGEGAAETASNSLVGWVGPQGVEALKVVVCTIVAQLVADRVIRKAWAWALSPSTTVAIAASAHSGRRFTVDCPEVLVHTAKTIMVIHASLAAYGGWRVVQDCRHDMIFAQSPLIPWTTGFSVSMRFASLHAVPPPPLYPRATHHHALQILSVCTATLASIELLPYEGPYEGAHRGMLGFEMGH